MADQSALQFSGERIVPQADNCEPNFALRMYQEHLARYVFASQLIQGKDVIDIGCGVGYGSQQLAQRGAASVYAFDLSEDAVRHARIYYSHPNLTFSVDNAEEFTTDRQFDVAVSFELIEHVHHAERVLQRIKRALKPDGILIMSTPRALEQLRTHHHMHEFSLEEYEEMIRKYFSNVDMYVENNHFSSLVTRSKPNTIQNIECLKEQYSLEQADVFISVSSSSSTPLPQLDPVVTLNDDSYVTMLERDVAILHKAEDDLRDRVGMIEGEMERLRITAENAEARRLDAFEYARNSGNRADGLQRELDMLRRDLQLILSAPQTLPPAGDQHREIVESMQRVFGGTVATHYLARDPIVDLIHQKMVSLQQEMTSLQQDLSGLHVIADDWHSQIMKLRNSKSWRFTKHFRGFGKFLGKIFK